jgi:excinuclease ABC subunit A
MPVEQALDTFRNVPKIAILRTLDEVASATSSWQSSTTPSGGEAQRVKLAKELAKRPTHAYILDEPPPPHFDDRGCCTR